MWVRKRIEITPADLCRGLWNCITPGDRQQICRQIGEVWKSEDALVCLSVRSGFDLLLHSSGWPQGSEIIMSGLTIPDMPRIVEANGLKAIGVDIDLATMQPDLDEIRQAITPQTKAIVVAHLLGGICDISGVLEIAREHKLMVIEDCAQAYVGSEYQGDERVDVSMFSFGPIKTNTALAGGVFRVRNAQLRETMERMQDQGKIQSRFKFAKRVMKYAFVKTISTRPLCGGFYRFMKLFGSNHDGVASTMARGFAGPGFFRKIRQQPSTPLMKLLHHKLQAFHPETTSRRRELGERLVQLLGSKVHVLGSEMRRQTYWVLPLLVDEPQSLVQKLWDAGFDGSNHCSLHAVVDDKDSTAASILRHIVFLPLHSTMPKSEIDRMAKVILQAAPEKPLVVSRRFADNEADVPAVASVEHKLGDAADLAASVSPVSPVSN